MTIVDDIDLDRYGPDLNALYRYWRRPVDEGRLPSRGDYDPLIEIPRLLPQITLVDVRRDPFDLRYRVVGTRIAELGGAELTGVSLYERVYSPDRKGTLADYEKIAAEGCVIARRSLLAHHRRIARINRLLMPLFDRDSGRVNMVMAAIEVVDIKDATADAEMAPAGL